jgi:uncharacterized lipoprotein YajG
MKTQLTEVICLTLSPAAPYFRYNHIVMTYLINKREQRSMCVCLSTTYHKNNLQNITTKSNFMLLLKSTTQKQITI